MKLAVASLDGVNISPHFGRSRCFLIFEVESGKIVGRSVRENTFTAHAHGDCGGGDDRHEHGRHDHAHVVAALQDCQAVICRGMGWRAAEELKQRGIETLVVPGELSPEEAVAQFLTGALTSGDNFCRCHEAS
ncbi:MAG: NifB/NifX family molybdenum-iron cluster-binding protein [Thermogutta sp.]